MLRTYFWCVFHLVIKLHLLLQGFFPSDTPQPVLYWSVRRSFWNVSLFHQHTSLYMIFYSLLFWYCKYGHRIIWYTRRTCFSSAALHSSLRQSLGVERIHQDVLSEDLIPRYLQSFFTLATLSMFKHIRNTIFAMCDEIITIGLTLFFDTYIGSITLW